MRLPWKSHWLLAPPSSMMALSQPSRARSFRRASGVLAAPEPSREQ